MVKVWCAVFLIYSSLGNTSQDPTAPLGWQKPETTEFSNKKVQQPLPKLQSIVCLSNDQCQAVLSGNVVLVGELVNGFKVSRIEPQMVTLSRGSKQWKLELFTLDIKH
ncbi:MSHA biogenesis protein MshK [Vibrio pectenicida]|uniref:MSHA biogenesis protein MshK n=1 Tax=Vibrio pectenicida TaxID=62763 RepID=UPI003B99C6F8